MGHPRRVWKFAAGHTGSETFWNDFRNHNRVALGHVKNRNLSRIQGSPRLEIELRELGQSPSVARQFKDFFRMKRGDIVVCYLRVGRLMGIGIVKDDIYRYSKKALDNGQEYPHRRSVLWLRHFGEMDLRGRPEVHRALAPRGPSDTIHEVKDKRVVKRVFGWVNKHLENISLEATQAHGLTYSVTRSATPRGTGKGASAGKDEMARHKESPRRTRRTYEKRNASFVAETPAGLFEIGRVYSRSDIHMRYGGQEQGGISTPAEYPFIMLFTGESGEKYGYRDGWGPDGTFQYTGEGQVGDMQFKGGNLAIRDHARNGEDLHLFQYVSSDSVQYVGQMVYAGHKLAGGVPDRNGNSRTAIVFYLVPMQSLGEVQQQTPVDSSGNEVRRSWYWEAPLHEVRAAALEHQQKEMKPQQARRNVYHRIEAVRVYVLRRANGCCEGCGQPAPFKRPDGQPYLELHHTRRISDGGPDHPQWVIAVCPTCHRRAHYAEDAETFNESLKSLATRLGGEE